MKPVKKILALILAGVMALALLTGCGKAASPDRAAAEGVADWMKYTCHSTFNNTNEISVSYQVPELSRKIAPLFDENWITYDEDNEYYVLNKNQMVNGKTVEATLTDILSNYKDASCTIFSATDVTECAGFASPEVYRLAMESQGIVVSGDDYPMAAKNATHLRVATTHKTIGDKTFLLAVIILEK